MSSKLIVACSGGLDSMCLLDLMVQAHPNPREKVIAHYVNHGQRIDSHKDAALIEKFCKKHGVEFKKSQLSIKKGASEEVLRSARYAVLLEHSKSEKATLLTAHHADDNLETILFRLIRGAHPESIKGIDFKTVREGVDIVRPLLAFRRAELETYAKIRKIPYRNDSTNDDTKFARNRIRKKIIPELNAIHEGADARILRFFLDLNRAQNSKGNPEEVSKIQKLVTKGKLSTHVEDFASFKQAIDGLLGSNASRATRAHWDCVKKILQERAAVKSGGGPQKVVQFPGGNCLVFKGKSLFWNPAK